MDEGFFIFLAIGLSLSATAAWVVWIFVRTSARVSPLTLAWRRSWLLISTIGGVGGGIAFAIEERMMRKDATEALGALFLIFGLVCAVFIAGLLLTRMVLRLVHWAKAPLEATRAERENT